jgi:two-component system, chemotaxis family, protein-glutamate methylesterase/glutaminase
MVTGHDLVVIGASAGGVEAIPRLLSQLPPSFPAAICIVQHLTPTSVHLADIFQRSTSMKVAWAEHDDPVVPGQVYVAPGGIHMVLDGSRIALVGGPRENRSRPSISRLFRSAAAHYGARTIACVLTGMLDDGASGVAAVKKTGGLVVVQDPQDAAFPDMPSAALRAADPDRVLPIEAIGAALILLSRQAAMPPPPSVPPEIVQEAKLDLPGRHVPEDLTGLGPQVPVACPECNGPLWEIGDERQRSFRCYLGHSVSAETMVAMKSGEIERSLWAAVRALQERASTLAKLAMDAHRIGVGLAAAEYERRSAETRADADRAREFLLDMQKRTVA